mgnify:CR=1 FL=1
MKGRVFFCRKCKKTFFVEDSDFKYQADAYRRALAFENERAMRNGTACTVRFILNGHIDWIYREDEDYRFDEATGKA